MKHKLQELLKAQTDRFFLSRLRDNEEELADLDEKIAELNERRRVVQSSADFCKSRLGIDD